MLKHTNNCCVCIGVIFFSLLIIVVCCSLPTPRKTTNKTQYNSWDKLTSFYYCCSSYIILMFVILRMLIIGNSIYDGYRTRALALNKTKLSLLKYKNRLFGSIKWKRKSPISGATEWNPASLGMLSIRIDKVKQQIERNKIQAQGVTSTSFTPNAMSIRKSVLKIRE